MLEACAPIRAIAGPNWDAPTTAAPSLAQQAPEPAPETPAEAPAGQDAEPNGDPVPHIIIADAPETPEEPEVAPIPAVWAPIPLDAHKNSAFGLYLAGRNALTSGESAVGADYLSRVYALTPEQPRVREQAFTAALLAGDLDELAITVRLSNDIVSFIAPLATLTDSEVPADPWRFFISGRGASSGANPTDAGSLFLGCSNAYVAAATSTFWLARNLSGSSGTGPIRAALCRLANVGDGVVAAIGGSTNNLVASSPGGAAEYWYPALIGCENTIRGRLRGVYIPANRLDGVAAGLDREDAVGLPANSRLTIVRHNTTWGGFFAQYDGHLGVESRLGW